MPVLKNARHELFCQAVASGRTLDEAYSDAGFIRNRGNASILNQKKPVQDRIDFLLRKRAKLIDKTVIKQVEVTLDSLIAELEFAREFAIKCSNPSALTMATMGKAKITGHVIDRREVGDVGSFDKLTDEELVAEAAKRARELGIAAPKLVEDKSDDDKSD